MAFEALKEECYKINMALMESGLVVLTWGNASNVDRSADVMAIKPSGVPYKELKPQDIVVLRISSGEVVDGKDRRPSSDTPTHLHLYQQFPNIGGVVHTHSDYATSFAQALMDLPCLGTTHADHFYGTIPCTRPLTPEEINADYELNTGKVIVDTFTSRGINPDDVPGVLIASHAPFAWGKTAAKALDNAVVLEYVAKMQLQSYTIRNLSREAQPIPQVLLDKHFLRKHGPGAYYGQPGQKH